MGPGSLPLLLLLRTGGDAYILVFIAWQVDGDGVSRMTLGPRGGVGGVGGGDTMAGACVLSCE